jgi:hypothetical protein
MPTRAHQPSISEEEEEEGEEDERICPDSKEGGWMRCSRRSKKQR